MRLQESRVRAQGLPDLLLYDALVANGVVLLNDGAFLVGWRYRGPDMASATHAELAALASRLNSILRLGSGWAIHGDAIRSMAPEYPRSTFPDPISRVIDAERAQQFAFEGSHFESEYFLTLTYLPPHEREEKLKGWLFEGLTAQRSNARTALNFFMSRVSAFEDVLGSILKVERLGTARGPEGQAQDRLLQHLRRCVTGRDHPFVPPGIPVYLNEIIGAHEFVGGLRPRLDGQHLRIVAIEGFPKASTPGILSVLDMLPMEYRWSTRAILLDATIAQALHDQNRRRWRGRIRTFRDQLFKTSAGAIDLDAKLMSEDAENAMSIAASGDVQYAIYSANIILMRDSEAKCDTDAALVLKAIRSQGFDGRVEGINAVEAWLGSLPGDGYCNVRRSILHTLNLADMLPITAVWPGERINPSALMPPESPPLLYAATTGATPFRFHFHVSDLGHTLMVGPPGAGKSTAIGLMVAQWRRYPRAQVFAFDYRYSLFVLAQAMGAEFYAIGADEAKLSFCPLQELDSPQDVSWAVDWVESLCVMQGMTVTPRERNEIAAAIQRLQGSPTRTLTELYACIQDERVREALHYYTLGGPAGLLLDGDRDSLGSAPIQVFEIEHVMDMGEKIVGPVLTYLFRRIEKRLDGSPTLIPIDEGWVALRHPFFRERLRDWFKTLRKLNAVVLLATQNLSDIANSPIRDVVLESCPTKILLPNAEAGNPASRALYETLGLNEREIAAIQTAVPKRDYYMSSPVGRRMVCLGIGPVALAFTGVNSREERQRATQCMAQSDWPVAWLKSRGLPDWAEYLRKTLPGERA